MSKYRAWYYAHDGRAEGMLIEAEDDQRAKLSAGSSLPRSIPPSEIAVWGLVDERGDAIAANVRMTQAELEQFKADLMQLARKGARRPTGKLGLVLTALTTPPAER